MFQVHAALQLPLLKSDAAQYQSDIDALLSLMVAINRPFSKSECNSIKYHWPRHWIGTRISLGCAAHEKSLERKLAETQKRNYKFTNHLSTKEVPNSHCIPRCVCPYYS